MRSRFVTLCFVAASLRDGEEKTREEKDREDADCTEDMLLFTKADVGTTENAREEERKERKKRKKIIIHSLLKGVLRTLYDRLPKSSIKDRLSNFFLVLI